MEGRGRFIYLGRMLTAGRRGRYGAVELGAAAPGKLVLVHSAAGGVGLHALQARRSGFHLILV